MSTTQKLARILAARSGSGIELALATESGQTLKVLATSEQIDMLVDELEDILNSPEEPEAPEPPAAA
ncbi:MULTISPECIES: hypothetical protein [unclassified Methylobacterium]|uniref:hypothetical protein n=1 Tax=unclassified Methylobacterium TaxID=2615210 RepID=UPI0006F1EE9D|nr:MULTISPECIES: hypothetical protein [unclassified Methylobacterium]KQP90831.1 hypothetical protein ASF60_03060 [Methylobacterium sp. Leaf113]KQP92205.1 hypothetical protein ASF57_07075 [Methylobacterium sp. Leaf117]MCK2054492.1 hypothetical protein [Methylobacterium sp. 37f]